MEVPGPALAGEPELEFARGGFSGCWMERSGGVIWVIIQATVLSSPRRLRMVKPFETRTLSLGFVRLSSRLVACVRILTGLSSVSSSAFSTLMPTCRPSDRSSSILQILMLAVCFFSVDGAVAAFSSAEGDLTQEGTVGVSLEGEIPCLDQDGLVELLAYVEDIQWDSEKGLQMSAVAEGRMLVIQPRFELKDRVPELFHKFVRVRGVLDVGAAEPSGLLRRILRVAETEDLDVLEAETRLWFEAGSRGVAIIRHLEEGGRFRSVGRLRLAETRGRVIFEDNAASIEVESEQASGLPLGVAVEMVFTARKGESDYRLVGNPVFRALKIEGKDESGDSASGAGRVDLLTLPELLENLTPLRQSRGKVGVMGAITLIGPGSGFAVLQDRSESLRILLPREFKRRISTSDFLYVEGRLMQKNGIDVLSMDGIAWLGKRPMPQAASLNVARASLNSVFQKRVALEGLVTDVRPLRDGMEVDLLCTDGEAEVWVRTSFQSKHLDQWVGSVARFEGVSLGTVDGKDGQQRAHLAVASAIHVTVTMQPDRDGSQRAITPFDEILRSIQRGDAAALVKASGVVMHREGERRLVLTDGRRALDAIFPAKNDLKQDEWIEVLAVPGEKLGRPVLRVVTFEKLERQAAILPQGLRLDQDDPLGQDASFVQFSGELLSIHQDLNSTRLIVSDGLQSVVIFLGHESSRHAGFPFAVGDFLETRGILRVLEDPFGGVAMPNIVLRDLDDMSLLRSGPFWTARRLGYLLALSLAAAFVAYLWNAHLRLKVRARELDLERQKRRSDSIEESKRLIMEQASDLMIALDTVGRITYLNSAGEEITGYSREEVVGVSIFDIVNRRFVMKAYLYLRRRKRQGTSASFIEAFRRKDGVRIWLQISPSVVEEAGEVVGNLVIARDVTREKEEMVALERAKALAERSAEAKARFLATMSHELRTPMNGMIGMMNILLDTDLSDDQVDCVKTVLSSSQALHSILSSILDYSKLESGAMVAEDLPFSPRVVVEESFKLMSASAVSKSIAAGLEGTESLPDMLMGDPGRLRQIIINLLGNAIKFTERGSVGLKVAVVSGEAGSVQVLFEVLDTGIGVEESEMENLFKAFHQADSSHARRYGGTGLGLAISRQLVTLLGGEMGVESKKGKGSRFWFRLPFRRADDSAGEGERGPFLSNERAKLRQVRDLKVLVAEDNPVNQKIIRLQLKKLGLKADVVENGNEAVAAVEKTYYDLILMDCQMPELDGWQATEIIRKSERNRSIMIIAVTANQSSEDKVRCRKVGMDGFVAKPTNPRKLKDEIDTVLARRMNMAF